MAIEYTLSSYSDEVRAAYLRLLPEQEKDVAQGKLDWKFARHPAGRGSISVAEMDGRVVGLNAFMPGRFMAGGQVVLGYQSMDTIVSEEARGQGVFGKLINCFYAETDGELIYGFPNLNSSPGFFGKLGWTSFGSVPMMMRPLRSGFFLRRFWKHAPDVPLPLLKKRARAARRIDRFGGDATRLWHEFARGIGCAVIRDADFLNWRLCDHPSANYKLLQAEDGAFVAWTVEDKHGGRIGYLMEAIGSTKSLSLLIASALHAMRKDGADLALAWCLPWSPNHGAYRRAGFWPFSERLRPIIINAGARPVNQGPQQVRAANNWYFSYLDSDTV